VTERPVKIVLDDNGKLLNDVHPSNSGGVYNVNSTTRTPSLIHYLKPTDAKFHVELSMSKEEDSLHRGAHFPFLVVSESDPLALTIEGSIVSDAGTKIENVFLLIQKDEYHLPKNEFSPTNNRSVDQAWQNVFSFFAAQKQNDSLVVLKDQVGDGGRLLPWSPLWYCHHRHIFFEPSCPRCGFPLEMCYDDDLLTGLGLEPYSTSLKRYLFCPRCFDKQSESDFYAHSSDVSDSAIVKDQQDLINGLGHLAREGNRHANIPCFECANVRECYETEHLSVSRIVTVSFYPFFMVVLPAPSIPLLDFLPMLAGAGFEDLANQLQAKGQFVREKCLRNLEQKNLQKSPFFFEKDERFFLEVLYVKLSLLGQLAHVVFSGLDTFKYPDLGLSIDHVWVKVAEHGGLLPSFWNFELKLFGIGVNAVRGPFPSELPPSYGLYFLGSVWFHVLLVNARQDVSGVYGEIAKIFEHFALKEDAVPEGIPRRPPSEIFSPQNIFWNPDEKAVTAAWESHWVKALDLGFLLLKRSMSEISRWSEPEFWQKFEELRDAIKGALFMPEPGFVRTSPGDESMAIREILMKIAEKWRSDSQTRPPIVEAGVDAFPSNEPEIDREDAGLSEDFVTKETVILRPEDFRDEAPSPKISDETLPETVVRKRESAEGHERLKATVQNEEDVPETIVASRDGSKAKTRPGVESQPGDIPETVVISPQDSKGRPSDSHETEASPGGDPEQRKRTPSKAGKDPALREKPITVEDEDEDLPKTAILDPSKTGKEP